MHSPIATTTPSTASGSLPPDADRGALQVPHLKRCWSRWMAARQGQGLKGAEAEAHRTQIVLAALGVGLEQTMQYVLREAPEFAGFEDWIVRTAGAAPAAPPPPAPTPLRGGPPAPPA